MAGKRRHYILIGRAEKDFRNARRWSLNRWGKELTSQYFSDVHRIAERVALSYKNYVLSGDAWEQVEACHLGITTASQPRRFQSEYLNQPPIFPPARRACLLPPGLCRGRVEGA